MTKTDIAKLIVSIEAKTGQFTEAMRAQTAAVSKFTGTIRTMGTAVFLAATGGGLAAMTRGILSNTDALAKQSRRLSITIAEMDALDMGFQKAGLSAGRVESVLDRMNKSLSEAATGNAEMGKALKDIGLDPSLLAGRNVKDAVFEMADAFDKLGTNVERITAATRIFGRTGGMMVEALNIDALKQAEERIKAIHDAIGATDVGNIEALNDSFTELKKTLEIVGRATVADMAGPIEDIAVAAGGAAIGWGKYYRAMKAVLDDADARGEGAFTKTLLGLSMIGPALFEADSLIQRFAHSSSSLGDSLFGEAFTEAVRDAEAASARLDLQLAELAVTIRGEMVTALDTYNERLNLLRAGLDKGMLSAEEYAAGIDSAREALEKASPSIQAAAKATEKYRSETERIKEEIAELQALLADGLIDEGTATRGIDKLNTALAELNPHFVEGRAQFEAMDAAAERLFEATRTPVESFMQEMAGLNDMLSAGVVEWDLYERGATAAFERMNKALEQEPAAVAMRQHLEGLQSAALTLFESTRTPLESFSAEVAELNELLMSGVVDWDLYGRGIDAAMSRAGRAVSSVDSHRKRTPMGAGVATSSTIGGLMAAGMIGGSEDIDRRQLVEQERQRHLLEQIVWNTQQSRTGVYSR